MMRIDVFSMLFGGIVLPAVWQMIKIAVKSILEGDDFDDTGGHHRAPHHDGR